MSSNAATSAWSFDDVAVVDLADKHGDLMYSSCSSSSSSSATSDADDDASASRKRHSDRSKDDDDDDGGVQSSSSSSDDNDNNNVARVLPTPARASLASFAALSRLGVPSSSSLGGNNNNSNSSSNATKKLSAVSDCADVAQELRDEVQRSKTTHTCGIAALQLTALPRGLPLSTLVHLDLCDNALCELPAEAFVGRCGQHLHTIDLHSNKLRSVPATLLRLPRLQVLALDHNALRELPVEAVGRDGRRSLAPALRRLSAEFNDLQRFPIQLFEQCTRLEQVLLGGNVAVLDEHAGELPYARLCACAPSSVPQQEQEQPQRVVVLRLDNDPRLVTQMREAALPRTLPWLSLQLHSIYPDRVLDYLYLGSLRTAQTAAVYRALDIAYVLTAGRDLDVTLLPGMVHRVLPMNDYPDEDPRPLFDDAYAFIEDARRAHKAVLVHCFAGLSRSATLAAAYLMRKRGLGAEEALARIRQARPASRPNAGFVRALAAYEATLRAATATV